MVRGGIAELVPITIGRDYGESGRGIIRSHLELNQAIVDLVGLADYWGTGARLASGKVGRAVSRTQEELGQCGIGFRRLGNMGRAMAWHNLPEVAATSCARFGNRTPAAGATLVAEGAELAATPAEAFDVDVAFTMLADDAALRGILIDSGLADRLGPPLIHVNMATISVAFAEELAGIAGPRAASPMSRRAGDGSARRRAAGAGFEHPGRRTRTCGDRGAPAVVRAAGPADLAVRHGAEALRQRVAKPWR